MILRNSKKLYDYKKLKIKLRNDLFLHFTDTIDVSYINVLTKFLRCFCFRFIC